MDQWSIIRATLVLLAGLVIVGFGNILRPGRWISIGTVLLWIGMVYAEVTRTTLPAYKKSSEEWVSKQAAELARKELESSPWTQVSYETKILSVSHQQVLVMFVERIYIVQFMDESGYVWYTEESMVDEGPWRQRQLSLHHNLLLLKDKGQVVKITYITKEKDPNKNRVLKSLQLDGKTIWPLSNR